MAKVMDAPAEAEAAGKKRGAKSRVLPEIDFSADVFTEFKDAAHALTDAFDSTAATYRSNMKALYQDTEAKTGVPKTVVTVLFAEERRLSKNAVRARRLEKSQVAAIEKVAEAFKGTPFGDIAQRVLDDAKVSVQ